MKRLFDIVFSSIGILLLFPFFILIAVLIKIDSKGSIVFLQKRVGQYNKTFNIYKFRTMVENAENIGPKVTIGKDFRITKVGHFLRKFKLDELPQLINVLLGDMSLVGPRPEVPEYVELYFKEIKDVVLSVRPGITDYASIMMIDESAILATAKNPSEMYKNIIMPQKLAFAVKYVKTRSMLLDIKIIILTIFKIIKR